jgi:Fic family protein
MSQIRERLNGHTACRRGSLGECLDALEKVLHVQEPQLPPLIKAGLAHVQFGTIHPFLDGNGRLGRLLITLMLCEAGALREPLLYLSLYFNARRVDYYRLLQEVRENGAWEGMDGILPNRRA